MTTPITTVPAVHPLPSRLEQGTAIGRYVIDGWLRDGGMASLYRGHHAKTGAKVAVKVQLGRADDALVTAARFEREGQVMGRLSGVPHVVQVHDVDELPDGRRYLVMEWIEGDNLEELLDDLRNADRLLEIERACRLMKDVALALVAVHRAQVVHRDLKPSNIMLDRSHPDREGAKLLDFGISADLGAGGEAGELTATGVVLGTSGYVAPEQALGLPADPGFDIYAFGIVLFEALTGYGLPPEGMGPERIPPVTRLRSGVPTALAELVSACLQRNPAQRLASAAVLVERLDEVLRGVRRPARKPAVVSERPTVEAGTIVGVGPGEGVASSAARAAARAGGPRVSVASSEGRAAGGPAETRGTSPAWVRARWLLAVGVIVLGVVVAGVIWRCGVVVDAGTALVGGGEAALGPEGPADEGRAIAADVGAELVVVTEAVGSTSLGPVLPTEGTSSGAAASAEDDATPAEPATASGSDDGTAVAKKPVKGPTAEQCAQGRRKAVGAKDRFDWSGVLRATAEVRCWTSNDQRAERKVLRVQAWAELGRFEQCIKEGAGSTDPDVARRTKLCRQRAAEGSG
jgi:Protein kinase domain